jgi:hypothetical protein
MKLEVMFQTHSPHSSTAVAWAAEHIQCPDIRPDATYRSSSTKHGV